MENEYELRAAGLRMKATALRTAAALLDLAAASAETTGKLKALSDVSLPFEVWPDIVLEDILDAEVIGEQ